MATCSFKTKLALSLTAAFSFFAMVFSLGGITLAAYLNAIEAEYSNRIDFSDLSDYFNSITKDADTGKTIYQISSEEELRNLQTLVSLGLFDEDDVFNLTSDIPWSGTPMAPIGSDDMPFNSTFNGCGHTITNLSIISTDGRNVGLFGYTSISSEIKNLILDHPTITVDGTGNYVSGSPIESVMLSAAEGMPDVNFVSDTNPGAANAINIENSGTNESTIYGFPKQVTAGGITYDVTYESSDESIIKPVESSSDIRFVTLKNTEPYAQNFQLYPATITAKVGFTIDDRFGYYVLERYQFNVLGNGLVSTAVTTIQNEDGSGSTTYNTGAFKTIHNELQGYRACVGFFIGKCDGKANHLGLEGGNSKNSDNNGMIIVTSDSRTTVYSSTSLIGRSRMDNPIDASAGDTMNIIYDFAGSINNPIDFSTDPSLGDNRILVHDFANGQANAAKGYGDGYTHDEIQNMYNLDQQASTNLSLDPDYIRQAKAADFITSQLLPTGMSKYSKIYPGTNSLTVANNPNTDLIPTTTNWEKTSFSETSTGEEDGMEGKEFNAQVLDGGLGAGTFTKVARGYFDRGWEPINQNLYYRLARGFTLNNAFLVWSTNEFTSYFGTDPFSINIDISYIAEKNDDSSDNLGQNSFQILYNLYNPEVAGQESDGFAEWFVGNRPNSPWTSSYLGYLFWQDLSHPYTISGSDFVEAGNSYDDTTTEATIMEDGKLHKTSIKIEINRENASDDLTAAWNTMKNANGIEVRYPVLAIGIGSNIKPMNYYADIYTETRERDGWNWVYENVHNRFIDSDPNSQNYVPFVSNDDSQTTVGDYVYIPYTSELLPLAKQNYQTYRTTLTADRAFGTSSDVYNSHERGYFNSYFDVENGTKVYIKDLSVTFTSREGNTESVIYNVDFIDSSTDSPEWNIQTETYNSWPNSSNVSVGFTMNSTSGGAEFSFYRNGNDVHGYYSSATYPLENTGDLFNNDAILGQG